MSDLIDKAEALLPCPFCGGEARISTRADECLWSHDQVEWTAISCSGGPDFDCFQPSVDWPSSATDEAGTQLSVSQWNRRAALPARGVGVKPLVWEHVGLVFPDGSGKKLEVANGCFGLSYHIYESPKEGLHVVGPGGFALYNTTIDAAKAAAQADYEARILAALAPTDAAHVNETPKSEHDGADVLTAAQAREAAARLLLDMLYMRNGAHEGVTKNDAQAMWEAASTREGYAAVDAFLRSIIGEPRT